VKYRSISEVLKSVYGQKIYKISLQSGCTCPNRDGTIGTGGCTFCSEGGSGDFAAPFLPIEDQIRLARQRVDRKIPASVPEDQRLYIAYFQSYTNTYGDTERLRKLYLETIRRPEICILSVGTRPDCLDDEKIRMLQGLNQIKPVWVELGLQTANDEIAEHIHRGYKTAVFDNAYRRLKEAGLTVIVHVILGLPGEHEEDMLKTVRHVSELFRAYLPSHCNAAEDRKKDPENFGWEDTTTSSSKDKTQKGYTASRGNKQNRIRQFQNNTTCSSQGSGTRESGFTDGIKFQLLHVLRGTQLADEYERTHFPVLTLDEYCRIVISCLKILPDETIVHRITGDGPKKLLIAPLWSADKKKVLNTLNAAVRAAEMC